MGQEIDYNEVFGVEEKSIEADDPAEQGAKERSVADSDSGNDEVDDGSTLEEDGAQQSDEENSKYAAARRKAEAERDLAIKQAREEADSYIDKSIKSMGLKNPYTGKTIETKADFEEYNKSLSDDKKRQFIKRSGMNEEEYKAFIETLPEVAEARLEKKRAEQIRIEEEKTRAKQLVDDDIKRISAIDPSIKNVSDLLASSSYTEVYDKVKKGYSLFDAYLSVNHNAISERAQSSSKQRAINEISGKEHLSHNVSRGNGAASVPADIAAQYRAFNPKATDAEIRKHYNDYLKKKS